jgi:hypothetical protein
MKKYEKEASFHAGHAGERRAAGIFVQSFTIPIDWGAFRRALRLSANTA